MITILRRYPLIVIFIISFLIFSPSLLMFFTNDDFFLLKIGRLISINDFFHSFSLLKGPDGLGMYRPLGIQIFYWTAWSLFNLNPIGQHVIAFVTFFAILFVLNKLIIDLTASKPIALITVFLYAVSATHFAHFYYLATYQEVIMTLFALLSVLYFIRKKIVVSLIFFILAIMSKETAVITPLLLIIVFFYQKMRGLKTEKIRKALIKIVPFFGVLAIYMSFRVLSYGFATGDSYVWDFSPVKLLNTLFWYTAWSFNLPETVLDFVGPGLKLNPNLIRYFGDKIIPIFTLFIIQIVFIGYLFIKAAISLKGTVKAEFYRILLFSIIWFIVSLLPVAFLPIHKFTFYLTLPLTGGLLIVAWLLYKYAARNNMIFAFLAVWTIASVLTLNHTVNTNWITKGQSVSFRVLNYINSNSHLLNSEELSFVDSVDDEPLPWSPTEVVKTALSDQNFFYVYYPQLAGKVYYGESRGTVIYSRQFLGY